MMLLSIARHCKLVFEHGEAGTTPEWQWEIVEEIQSLRSMRGGLIAEWRKGANT
jgi:hypothetical protein